MPAPLLDIRPDHWKIVYGILQAHIPQHEVWAFGSRAKWTAKEYSDLDLCIVSDHPLGFSLLGAMADDFSESDLPYKIDLVDWATTSESFRKIIERDKVVVQKGGKSTISPAPTLDNEADWPIVRLGDHCIKIGSGATPKGGKEAYLDHGPYSLIRSQNIYNEGFSWGGLAYISDEQAKKLDGVAVNAGDVLLNITGDSVARVCSAPEKVIPARVNQHVAIIRPDDTAFDSRFIRYFLASPKQQDLLLGMASAGATRNALTKGMIEDLRIPKPSMPEQTEIAEVLSSLDDKILLLRETNATLEAIAQALFKSWFVDFDPVRAKQAGCTSEGMDEATAALFPDSFEESELGLVPRGWRVGTVEDLCSVITNGGTPSRSNKKFWEGGTIPWFKTGDFSDGFLLSPVERITDDALKGSSAKLLPADSILMAIYAAPTVGRLGVLTEPATFNQACTGMVAKGEVGTWFLYWTLYSARDWFNNRANGAAQQNISKAIVASCKVTIPAANVLMAFNQVAVALHNRIRANSQKVQTLVTLRDTLLPRLISGLLRVPDVDNRCSREEISS